MILALMGLIPLILFGRLRDVSYNEQYLIIKGIQKDELVELHRIKRIYRSNVMTNYTIEYLDGKNTARKIDFWPAINFSQLLGGQMPDNLIDLIKRIRN